MVEEKGLEAAAADRIGEWVQMSGGEELVEKLLGMTYTFGNWDKYIWKFEKIYFAIGANIFCKWEEYILQFAQTGEWVQMSGGRNLQNS